MKTLFIGSLLLLLFGSVAAQKTGIYGGMGGYEGGLFMLQMPGTNQLLQNNGYTSIGPNQMAHGGMGMGIINNFMIGGQGGSISEQSFSRADNAGTLKHSYGSLQLGYLFRPGKKLAFFPIVGLGTLESIYEITNNNTSNDLQQAFQQPNQMLLIQQRSPYVDFSVNLNYWLFKGKKTIFGPFFGLSLGGFYAPATANYRMNGQPMVNTPTQAASSFYIKLRFGGGSITESGQRAQN